MDPITLHFNVFQAGATAGENRRTLCVEDPCRQTVLSLKQQLFGQALKEQRSIRFIAAGRVLDDKVAITKCNLGREAHIHVSISGAGHPGATPPSSPSNGPAANPAVSTAMGSIPETSTRNSGKESAVTLMFILGCAFFVGTGLLLRLGWQKRLQLSMHSSQLLFICAAVWAYLLLCHGIPAFFQCLMKMFQKSGDAEKIAEVTTDTPTTKCGASTPTISETHGVARARSVGAGFDS